MPDFVIIGGGVYGCATAYELAKQGADVCLLEANMIASGASGGLGKRGVRASGRDVRELPLMEQAYDIWPTLHEELGGETGYEQVGHLLVIERDIDLTKLQPQLWLQNQLGVESHLLDAGGVQEMEPHISKSVIAAIYTPGDGIADHTTTTRSYAAAATRLGADIREHTAAVSIERRDNRVTAVITNNEERIEVKRGVLLCSNLHSQQFLAAELGVTLPVWCMYPQVLSTEPIRPMPLRHLIGHASRTLAMKAVADSRVMISGGWHGVANPQTGVVEPHEDQVNGNVAQAVATYPTLEGVQVHEVSVERPELVAQDGIPIIDTFSGATNMVVATGWCGHGWAISPSTARHLSTWLLTGTRPEILAPFGYGRFRPK